MKTRSYPLVDLGQFIAALCVVLIHSGQLSAWQPLHFGIKSLLCRLAVPFFLVTTGFFFRERMETSADYPRNYFKRLLKNYLFWSLLYLPYAILFIQAQNIPLQWYPAALLGALLYTGTCYHLWYFPGLAVGLSLTLLTRNRKRLAVFGIAIVLYTFGSLETYSSYIQPTVLNEIYQSYKSFFYTTKNGWFYSFMFVFLGFVLSECQSASWVAKGTLKKLLFSLSLMLLEGILIYVNQGDDKNFLFSLIPVSFYLSAWLLQQNKKSSKSFFLSRSYSQYLFYLHPLILESLKKLFGMQGIPLFILTVTMTSCIYFGIIRPYQLTRKQVVYL